MLHLKTSPTLTDIQTYVKELEVERGFTNVTLTQNCLMLGEEVGELFKAVRKAENMHIDPNSKLGTVEEELADAIIFLCSIANRLNVNLEQAFRDKEEINKGRHWQRAS
ncbi:MAG TPA: MazG nucleotide pyrophosphohydrolase domain-containing protein [Candidatus Acidoferrum sp.]|nr:MazG nucleotide pyrophosphohydrolase domain-containing protein [Candidatus Acidoferrum sp.]